GVGDAGEREESGKRGVLAHDSNSKPQETTKRRLQGRSLEPFGLRGDPFLLQDRHRLDGLRLGGAHVPGLASCLSLTDQLRSVTARSLGTRDRTRSLCVLTARGLRVLAATRRLNVLTSTRGLRVLATTRRLNILAGTRQRPRRLNILRLGHLLEHRLSLANLSRALRLRIGDRRQRREHRHAHDCCEESLHHLSPVPLVLLTLPF